MRIPDRQTVKARRIDNSVVEQYLGDKYVITQWTASQPRPIYLTYADSDVQALYLNSRPGRSHQYLDALNEAMRLLVCFKPLSAPLIVSPSSLVQSSITRSILIPFLQTEQSERHQILVIRRESTWEEYFDKRQVNTQELRRSAIYSGYFDSKLIREISGIEASRKKFFSGADTVRRWSKLVQRTAPVPPGKAGDINELAGAQLATTAFVYETAMDMLTKLDINVQPSDARGMLVDAYHASVTRDCAVPTGIRLPWDPCPANRKQEAYPIQLLAELARSAHLDRTIMRADPKDLFSLASSPVMELWRTTLHKLLGRPEFRG